MRTRIERAHMIMNDIAGHEFARQVVVVMNNLKFDPELMTTEPFLDWCRDNYADIIRWRELGKRNPEE